MRLKKLDIFKQQEFCEFMCSDIMKHSFYVLNPENSVASFGNLDNVPFINPNIKNGELASRAYEALDPEMVEDMIGFELREG